MERFVDFFSGSGGIAVAICLGIVYRIILVFVNLRVWYKKANMYLNMDNERVKLIDSTSLGKPINSSSISQKSFIIRSKNNKSDT